MPLRLCTWNIGWFGQLLQGKTRTLPKNSKKVTTRAAKALQAKQRDKIAEQIRRVDPDVLCIQEGPSTGNIERLRRFCDEDLEGRWTVIDRPPGDTWHIRGSQGIFFVVKSSRLRAFEPRLLSQTAWFEATEIESRTDMTQPGTGEHNKKWPIIHPLFKPDGRPSLPEPEHEDEDEGAKDMPELMDREHTHFRHPQVLVLTVGNRRVDLIGCHLKSKFGGDEYGPAGALRLKAERGEELTENEKRKILKAEQTAVEARIKLSTEATNIRYFIENRFRNEPDPVVFVLGDMNDGVGKEVFERKYLFHDAISNLQGEVFFADRFLNHALFDFDAQHRWTASFTDVWDPGRPPEILLDHILFTQSVTGPDALDRTGMRVLSGAGRVEHEIHNAVNAVFDRKEEHTSDHRPVTVDIALADDT
ncbi:MAG: hypothetical protein AAFU77_02865 [Myxococcota bacterium]